MAQPGMPSAPALVVLAAGMGSRYGGLKQLDPVGPAGETLLDYAVFDARRAGFGRVIFVIRRDFAPAFDSMVGARYADLIPIDTVFQSLEGVPGTGAASVRREKPWGTGHAVLCARAKVDGPFAVINADDFYGRESYARLAAFLTGPGAARPSRFALVGFRLDRTLSEHGTVSRGVCAFGPDGGLKEIVEHTRIAREDVGPGLRFSGDETVSMNCWGLTPAVFPALERAFAAFAADPAHRGAGEFYLPAALSQMIATGQAEITVLPTAATWHGITYRDDKARVAAALRALHRDGTYPDGLATRLTEPGS